MRLSLLLLSALYLDFSAYAQAQQFSPTAKQFITVGAPVFALTHVKVIDGTGVPARDDQTIVVSGGKIQAIGDSATVQLPASSKVMEMRGYTVIPGLVGMTESATTRPS